MGRVYISALQRKARLLSQGNYQKMQFVNFSPPQPRSKEEGSLFNQELNVLRISFTGVLSMNLNCPEAAVVTTKRWLFL